MAQGYGLTSSWLLGKRSVLSAELQYRATQHSLQVTDGVHNSGSFIFTQLHALGRAADESLLTPRGLPYVSASDVRLEERPNPPRALTREEIAEYVKLYAVAAKNAVEVAGFDGVE